MKRHDVPLAPLVACALEHVALDNGVHLLRFYDRPEDWGDAPALTRARLSIPGIFDVETIRPRMVAAQTFLELHDVIRKGV